MTQSELCDFVDDKDPAWFYKWCEREGSWEELVQKAVTLGALL